MIMEQVVDPPMTKFWVDSDVYKLMLDYYRQRQKHSFFDSSPNIRSRFWYTRPDSFNSYQFSNYQKPNIDAFNFQPVSALKYKYYLYKDKNLDIALCILLKHCKKTKTEPEAIQSRRRYPTPLPTNVIDLAAQERLFGLLSGGFGGAPVYVSNTSTARPFLGGLFTRTYIFVSTSTITTFTTPVCIPSAVLPAGYTTCARRRRGMNIPLDFYLPIDGNSEISPTTIEKYDILSFFAHITRSIKKTFQSPIIIIVNMQSNLFLLQYYKY
jgi:hypothetical protein